MVRGKTELKKIENVNSQRVAFSKRRAGLFKKASELSILCNAKVGVIVYSNTGKLYEFASTDCMNSMLSKYNVKYAKQCSKPQPETKTGALKSESANLQDSLLRMERKDDLGGMNLPELQRLVRELQEGLLLAKDRVNKVALEELEKSQLQERRVSMENQVLRDRIEVYKRDANASR